MAGGEESTLLCKVSRGMFPTERGVTIDLLEPGFLAGPRLIVPKSILL